MMRSYSEKDIMFWSEVPIPQILAILSYLALSCVSAAAHYTQEQKLYIR